MPMLSCLSVSHHLNPLDVRERLSFYPDEVATVLEQFTARSFPYLNAVRELAILSTCNRTELYASTDADFSTTDDRAGLYEALMRMLAETRSLDWSELQNSVEFFYGEGASLHLHRVAAGLESVIVGEPQILGQVSQAYEIAVKKKAAGAVLANLFRSAVHAGKRARSETEIGRRTASFGSIAVRFAEQACGSLAGRSVLVIGAGEMARLVIAALHARGVRLVTIANRTSSHSRQLAEKYDYTSAALNQLPDLLARAEVVFSAANANRYLIGASELLSAWQSRNGHNRVIVDAGVPRNVDPAVHNLPGITLYDLDDLESSLQHALEGRRVEIPKVETIVTEESSAFEAWLREYRVFPTISAIRETAEQIRRREVEKTLRRLPDLDDEAREKIQRMTKAMLQKLLHEPTVRLRAEARRGRAQEYDEVVRRLFGLPHGSRS